MYFKKQLKKCIFKIKKLGFLSKEQNEYLKCQAINKNVNLRAPYDQTHLSLSLYIHTHENLYVSTPLHVNDQSFPFEVPNNGRKIPDPMQCTATGSLYWFFLCL